MCRLRTGGFAVGLWLSVSGLVAAESQVLLDDARARVALIRVSDEAPYNLAAPEPNGAVWVALDDSAVVDSGDGGARKVLAGVPETLGARQKVIFAAQGDKVVRIIVVEPRKTQQPLTVETLALSAHQELQDASDRNDTLLIALSPLRLRDVWNVGDESDWKPSKPRVLLMPTGAVTWLRSGMHHLTNLLGTDAKFLTLEW